VAARNRFAPLSEDTEMEEVEEEGYATPLSPASAAQSPAPSPSPPSKKAPKKKKAAPARGAKKKASSGKPRKKRGEGHREDVAAAAAAAAISASEAARMPAGLVRDGASAIAKADAERKAATEKLERLSAAGETYVFRLRRLKEGEHGVAKAPYHTPARGAAARTLPSVAEGHTSVTSDDWPENRRRPDSQRTANQRARREPFVPGSKAGRTWCSRVEEKAGVNQPPLPSSAKSCRERLALPEQPSPTEKQKRAVSLRVRFVDQTADAGGVMGAAPPAPGNKTRADVRRAFTLAGRGQAYVYSEAVKIVYSQPEGEQGKMALSHGLLNKVMIVKKGHAFSCKDEKDSLEYIEKKASFDAEAAKVQALRDQFYNGKSLLDFHAAVEKKPWLHTVFSNVLTQALRDVSKAFKSNFAKLQAQKARGAKKVRPFRVKQKDPRKRSSHTFYVLANSIKATHVPRPDLYNVAEAKRSAAGKPPSGLQAHRARQKRERRQWTRLELPPLFSGQTKQRTVVYLTRCADLDKDGKLLGDVRFTRDDLGRWNCVVQRRPRAVRPLRPVAERKVMADDQGVRDAHTCYSPSEATVTTYGGGKRGIDFIFERHLEPADKLIMKQRELKRSTDFENKAAREAYEKASRKLAKQRQRHIQKAKNLIKEMHCRVARDMTAKFDTILLPPFNTKDMARRRKRRTDGSIERRRLKAATVRRLLFMSFYRFSQLVGHRCLCDGSEKLQPGEEFSTIACTFWCVWLFACADCGCFS